MPLTALPCRAARMSARPLACTAPRARVAARAAATLDFDTTAFQKDLVEFAGSKEYIVKGGRDKFKNLPQAFKDIKEASPPSLTY